MDISIIVLLRVFGVLGVAGSATIMVADWIGATPAQNEENSPRLDVGKITKADLGVFTNFIYKFVCFLTPPSITRERTIRAAWLGSVAMAPTALGFVAVFVLLSPAGVFPAALTACLMIWALITGTFAHPGLSVVHLMTRELSKLDRSSDAFKVVDQLLESHISFYAPSVLPGLFVGFAGGSFLFSFLVFFADTHYPWWMGFFNPFIISFFISSNKIIPWSIRRWTAAANMHIFSILPFLGVATYLAWNGV